MGTSQEEHGKKWKKRVLEWQKRVERLCCQLMNIKIEMLDEEEEKEDKFIVGRVDQQS